MTGKLAKAGAALLFAFSLGGIAAPPRPAAQRLTPAPVAPAGNKQETAAPIRPALLAARQDDAFVLRGILPIDQPLRHGQWVWDDTGVPAGPIVITVDLEAQVLSVFRGGYEIGTAVILYGADDKPTPLGRFAISQKDAKHVSNLYDAPMPYMLRLTNDGVSIHGSDVRYGVGTHGCVGVPTAFAAKLFAQVKLGDQVIVTSGATMALGDRIIS